MSCTKDIAPVLPAPKGDPVLAFLPGLFETACIWDAVLARLPDWQNRAIRLDLPGHGCGDAPDLVAEDLASGKLFDRLADRLRRRAGDRRIALVGHSTGAMIALLIARRHPGIVHSVVVMGGLTSGRRGRAVDPAAQILAHPVLGPGVFRLGWRLLLSSPELFRHGFRRSGSVLPDPCQLDAIRGQLADCDPMAVRACARWVIESDISADLPEIDAPILALIGTRDLVVSPDHQLALIRSAPNAHARLLDAGHLLWVDCPDAVARVLRAWLALPPQRVAAVGPDGETAPDEARAEASGGGSGLGRECPQAAKVVHSWQRSGLPKRQTE